MALTFTCLTCNVHGLSFSALLQHVRGRKHRNKGTFLFSPYRGYQCSFCEELIPTVGDLYIHGCVLC